MTYRQHQEDLRFVYYRQSPQREFYRQLSLLVSQDSIKEWIKIYQHAFQLDDSTISETKHIHQKQDKDIQSIEGLSYYIQQQFRNFFSSKENMFLYTLGSVRFVQFQRVLIKLIKMLLKKLKAFFQKVDSSTETEQKQIIQKIENLIKYAKEIPSYIHWIFKIGNNYYSDSLDQIIGDYISLLTKLIKQLSLYCWNPKFIWGLTFIQCFYQDQWANNQATCFIGAPIEACRNFLFSLKGQFEHYQSIDSLKSQEASCQHTIWSVAKHLLSFKGTELTIPKMVSLLYSIIKNSESSIFKDKKWLMIKILNTIKNAYFHCNGLHQINNESRLLFFQLRYIFFLVSKDQNFNKSFQQPTQYLQWTRQFQRVWFACWKQSFNDPKLCNMLMRKNPESMVSYKQTIEDDIFQDQSIEQILGTQLLKILELFKDKNMSRASLDINPQLLQEKNLIQLIKARVKYQIYLNKKFKDNSNKQQGIQIYFRFIQMQKILKEIYFSFRDKVWIFPLNVLGPLNLAFFKKCNEDIVNDVMQLIYSLGQKIMKDQIGQKLTIVKKAGQQFSENIMEGQNHLLNYEFKYQPITKAECLDVMLFFINQTRTRGQIIHIPTVIPNSLQSSIIYIISLKGTLGYNNPSEQKKKLYCDSLNICRKYGAACNQFFWYSDYLSQWSKEQGNQQQRLQLIEKMKENVKKQFQLVCSIPVEQAKHLLFTVLYSRDHNYLLKSYESICRNMNEMLSCCQYSILNRGISSYSNNYEKLQKTFLEQKIIKKLSQLEIKDINNLNSYQMLYLSNIRRQLQIYISICQDEKDMKQQIVNFIANKIILKWIDERAITKQQPQIKKKGIKNTFSIFFQEPISNKILLLIGHKIPEKLEKLYQCSQQDIKNYSQHIDDIFELITGLSEKCNVQNLKTQDVVKFYQQLNNSLKYSHPNLKPDIFFSTCQILFKMLKNVPTLAQFLSLNLFCNQQSFQSQDWKIIKYILEQDIENSGKRKSYVNHIFQPLKKEVIKIYFEKCMNSAPVHLTNKAIQFFTHGLRKKQSNEQYKRQDLIIQNLQKYQKTLALNDKVSIPLLYFKCQSSLLTFLEQQDIFFKMFKQPQDKDIITDNQQLCRNWNTLYDILQRYQRDVNSKETSSSDLVNDVNCCFQNDSFSHLLLDQLLQIVAFENQLNIPRQTQQKMLECIEILAFYFSKNEDIYNYCQKYNLCRPFKKQSFVETFIKDPKQNTLLQRILNKSFHKIDKLSEKSRIIYDSIYQNLQSITEKLIDSFTQRQNENLHPRVIYRLFAINEHFPSDKISQFIIKNFPILSKKQFPIAPLKSGYLHQNIVKLLQELPENILQIMLLKNSYQDASNNYLTFKQIEDYHSTIVNIFKKLQYIDSQCYNISIEKDAQMIEKIIKEQQIVEEKEQRLEQQEQKLDLKKQQIKQQIQEPKQKIEQPQQKKEQQTKIEKELINVNGNDGDWETQQEIQIVQKPSKKTEKTKKSKKTAKNVNQMKKDNQICIEQQKIEDEKSVYLSQTESQQQQDKNSKESQDYEPDEKFGGRRRRERRQRGRRRQGKNQDQKIQERKQLVDMFYSDQQQKKKQLVFYQRYIKLRQQIAQHIDYNYAKQNNPLFRSLFQKQDVQNQEDIKSQESKAQVIAKIKQIVKILQSDLPEYSTQQIINKIPQSFCQLLNIYGFSRCKQDLERIANKRKRISFKKMMNIENVNDILNEHQQFNQEENSQRFFDNDEINQYFESNKNSRNRSNQIVAQQQYFLVEDPSSILPKQSKNIVKKKSSKKQQKLVKKQSKITLQINKNSIYNFDKIQVIKIVEICIYCLLTLRNQIKKANNFFKSLFQTKIGPIVMQQTLNVLRIDQNLMKFLKNKELLLQKYRKQEEEVQKQLNKKVMAHLPKILNLDLMQACFNLFSSFSEYSTAQEISQDDKRKFISQSNYQNSFSKQIKQYFELSSQKTSLTCALLYIRSKNYTIRQQITKLKFQQQKQTDKLSTQQLDIIAQSIYQNQCNPHIFDKLKNSFNWKYHQNEKIRIFYEYYAQKHCQVMWQLLENFKQLQNRIMSNPGSIYSLSSQPPLALKRSLSSVMAQQLSVQYQLYSSLLSKFYNKINIFFISIRHQITKLPQEKREKGKEKLQKRKCEEQLRKIIMNNEHMIQIIQISFYILDGLKEKFHNKIAQKNFMSLIDGPDDIIRLALMILLSLTKSKDLWKNFKYAHQEQAENQQKQATTQFMKDASRLFGGNKVQMKQETTKQIAEQEKYQQLQSYEAIQYYIKKKKWHQLSFKSIQDVSKLFFFFLEIERFHELPYTAIVIPHLMRNPLLSKKIPLLFKAFTISDKQDQTLYVTRECSFDMAYYQLNKNTINIQYYGEDGIDQGGLVREFIIGWENKQGLGEQQFFIGRLLGISFKDRLPYGGKFDFAMAAAITQYKLTLEDLQKLNPPIYRSLKFINQYKQDDGTIQELCLNFMIEKNKFGKNYYYQLVPNGNTINLTFKNKNLYVQKYLQKYLSSGRQWELLEICNGFYTIINKRYIRILQPEQLIRQIKGEQIIDCKKMKKRATYESGYSAQTQIIVWFWEVLQTFNQQDINKFIQFVTGSPKLAIHEWNFALNIQKVTNTDMLPVAHTCFKSLDLPEYSTKEILEKRLRFAIYQGNQCFAIS